MIKTETSPVKTPTHGENTKMNIIQAAGELAALKGFDNVTTRMVADRSGENIGSIHYHFGGKNGLFEAVVLEAISGCCNESDGFMDAISEDAAPEALSNMIRLMVSGEITDMFRSDRPVWHVPVIYQLLQREDHLSALFDQQVLQPDSDRMGRFFRIVNPDADEWDIHLYKVLMKMPIFAHADYMKTMLKMLGTDHYSEAYLQRMEDLVVKQTQLLLGLPLDK
jgi:AcrR family transcriptional regulator